MAEWIVEQTDLYHPISQTLIHKLAHELASMYSEDEEVTNAYLNEMKPEERSVFLVVFDNHVPIGCGMIHALHGETDTAEVKRMYVEPDYRSKGVGAVLLTALEEQAESLGYVKMKLETGKIQYAAIRLYEKMGYTYCECYGRFATDPLSVCFHKPLA